MLLGKGDTKAFRDQEELQYEERQCEGVNKDTADMEESKGYRLTGEPRYRLILEHSHGIRRVFVAQKPRDQKCVRGGSGRFTLELYFTTTNAFDLAYLIFGMLLDTSSVMFPGVVSHWVFSVIETLCLCMYEYDLGHRAT